MSTDYSAVCLTCRTAIHIGQRFTTGWAFGYGSSDLIAMRQQGEWLMRHTTYPTKREAFQAHAIMVVELDFVPDGIAHEEIAG